MNKMLMWLISLICIFGYIFLNVVIADDNVLQLESQRNSSLYLRTPQDVRRAFEATDVVTQNKGTFKIPALVSDDILIRAVAISSKNDPQGGDREHVTNSYALNRSGQGKWFTFVGGNDLVEKVLVAGQYNATKVYRDIGYGSEYQCGKDIFYWLVVFRKAKDTFLKNGVYENLQSWLKHVYGKKAPIVPESALKELKEERFADVTGCPVDPVTGAFDTKNLQKCNKDFYDAVTKFWGGSACNNNAALTYKQKWSCPTDKVFLDALAPPLNAMQIRAYLYAVDGFNEYNTGYGYTANSYDDPMSREYWMDNSLIKDLPNVELLQVQCSDSNSNGQDFNGIENSPYVTIY